MLMTAIIDSEFGEGYYGYKSARGDGGEAGSSLYNISVNGFQEGRGVLLR